MSIESPQAKSSITDSASANNQQATQTAKRVRNLVVVVIAAVLSVAIVVGLQTRSPAASLSDMAEESVPLNVALANGKPTLIEFYANWCTSCQAMAPDMQQLKEDYGKRVNFVMLNVDNTKWLPEMLNYRVDGIPHFEFLSGESLERGAAIGEIPRSILAENLDALVGNQPLPNAQIKGEISELDNVDNPITGKSAGNDPRSHGAQVVD